MTRPFPVTSSVQRARRPADAGASLLDFLNVLLKHFWAIAFITIVCIALVVVPALTGKRTYTSNATFMNQSRRAASAVSGVASQLGINLAAADAPSSPQFYADLATSNEILEPVVKMKYRYRTNGGVATGTLADVYEIKGSPGERVERAVEALRNNVKAEPSAKTGVVTLTVTGPEPVLVRDVSSYILDQLNGFNLRSRQAQAVMERQFAEGRLEEASQELRAAENRLNDFREQNRFVSGATRLETEQDRLTRQVAMRQQLYITLAQTYEQARIDELRAFPVLSVIQGPRIPIHPNSRAVARKGILALAFGLFLGILFALVREYFAKLEQLDEAEFSEFSALRRKRVQDLMSFLRLGRQKRAT